jgi:hypothetical protein
MMVGAMRWTALILLPVLAGAAEIGGSNVRTVYVLPMAHGLDQYVANHLTREKVFDVVADPARADAILTDGLGKPLENELEKLHPKAKSQEADAEDESAEDASADDDSKASPSRRSSKMLSNAEPPVSTFGRGKGTLFLVDTQSRSILWSVYERPKGSAADQLDRTAKRVVDRLKRDLAGK